MEIREQYKTSTSLDFSFTLTASDLERMIRRIAEEQLKGAFDVDRLSIEVDFDVSAGFFNGALIDVGGNKLEETDVPADLRINLRGAFK